MKRMLFLVLCCVLRLVAASWYVHPDSALSSIQEALDSCSNNDTVLVGQGTYNENIWWPTTYGINLISEAGPESTIIDGQQSGRVIYIPDIGSDRRGIINGFTITNGYTDWKGGGIYCCADSFTIRNNHIVNNESYGNGNGGGICILSNKMAFIDGNVIMDNESPSGGGIYCRGSVVRNNVISGNTSSTGGGVFCEGATGDMIIRNNVISQNSAHYHGGGIWINLSSDVVIVGNEIDSNEIVLLLTGEGAGICLWNGSTGSIDSCSITHNTGQGVCINHGSHPTLHYNNIVGNTDYGIENKDIAVIINAEYNWWGNASGPYHPDSNPGGTGDSVSDYVDFIPWLDHQVGVEEEEDVWQTPYTFTVEIFPNPFKSDIGLQIKDTRFQLTGTLKIHVYNVAGNKVMSSAITASDKKRTVKTPNTLPSGVYFVEVRSGDSRATLKAIKLD
jgi:parallel beta-helix repeat protein